MKLFIQLAALILIFCFIGETYGQAPTLKTLPTHGHYCAGEAGVRFQIHNSALNQTYTLRRQGGSTVATATGNGGLLTFPGYHAAGVYFTVPATTFDTAFLDPRPVKQVLARVPASGEYCDYPTANGVELKINGSQVNMVYQLVKVPAILIGDPWKGDGSSHSFGFLTTPAGTTSQYFVLATDTSTVNDCSQNTDTVSITCHAIPVAAFSFTPANPTPPGEPVCANFKRVFTNLSTGVQLTYSWRFDDPPSGVNNTSSLPNPEHIFESFGNGTKTFNVRLIATNKFGCKDTIIQPVTVNEKPDPKISGNGLVPNLVNTFAFCGASLTNPTGTFTFYNASTTALTNNLNYNIDFDLTGGAVPPTYTGTTFNDPITVTYTGLGNHTLKDSITGTNGCNNTRYYTIYVGNFAQGNIDVLPFFRYGLSPHEVQFRFSNDCYGNTPSTLYILNYGDGIVDSILQENLPADGILTHVYSGCPRSKVLCDLNNEKFNYKMSYSITNACNTISSNICPIMVNCPTTGGFGPGIGGGSGGGFGFGWFSGDTDSAHIVGCNTVTFSNTTTPGFFIDPFGIDTTTVVRYHWDFDDGTTSQEKNPTHTFALRADPYEITLITWTGFASGLPNINLTADTIVKYLYIQPPPTASFVTDNSNLAPNICIPKIVKVSENTSYIGNHGIPHYSWRVLDAITGNQMPPESYNVITPQHPGDHSFPTPWFEFNLVGKYFLELTVTNMCGDDIEKSDTILVCMEPVVEFEHPDTAFCGAGARIITPAYTENCGSPPVSYAWTVDPPTATFVNGTTASSKFPEINFPGLGDYTLTVTISNLCGNDSKSCIVHIVDNIENNNISLDNNVYCGNLTPPVTIAGSQPQGGWGTFQYVWQRNPGGTGWVNIGPGGNGQHYTITTPLTTSTMYRRLTYDMGDCISESNIVPITIYPPIVNNVIFEDQQVCGGMQPQELTGLAASGGDGTITYDWQVQNPDASWTSTGATSANYLPPPSSVSVSYRRVAHSASCTDPSVPVSITACNPVSNNTIDIAGQPNAELCAGTTPPQINGSLPEGACSNFGYQWQKSDNDPFTVFSDIPGATSRHYQPPALTITSHYRRIVIPASATACENDTTSVVVITVFSNPIVTADANPTSVPNTGTTNLIGNVTGGTPPYTWTWTSVPAGFTSSLQNPVSNPLTITTIFYLQVTDSHSCIDNDDVTVTVGGAVTCNAIVANATQVCPGCPNGNVNLSITASGGTGTYTYSWSAVPSMPVQNTSSISVCPGVNTTYTCNVTDGLTSCSKSITVTVDPLPSITSVNEMTICSGSSVNYSPTANVPGTTYTWTSSSANGCSGNQSTGGVSIPDVLINSGNLNCNVTYTIAPKGPGPNFCTGNPFTLTVTVLPVTQIVNSSNYQTIASGQQTAPVTFLPNNPSAGVEWNFNSVTCPDFISPYTMSGNSAIFPPQTLEILPGGPSTCTLEYIVRPYLTLPNGTKCYGSSFTYSIVINADPTTFNLICPVPFTVCEGTPVTISLDGSEVGIDYTLQLNGIPVPGTLQGGTGAVLTWFVDESGSYTILASNPSNGQSLLMNGACQVLINPVPTGNYLISSTGNCSGDLVLLNGSQIGVNYELYRDGVSTHQVRQGTGTVLSFDATSLPGVYTIKALYPITQCFVWIDGEITLHPNPEPFVLNPSGDLCLGMELELDSSQVGILYQLWCIPDGATDPVAVGPPVPGTGFAIPLGAQNTPGVYYVQGYNPLTTCDLEFPDRRTYRSDPVLYNITPQASAAPNCEPTIIGLSNSQPGFRYYLHKLDQNGIPLNWPYYLNPVIGTGSAIQFSPPVGEPGTYVVIARYNDLLCPKQMNGTVIIEQGLILYDMNPTGNPVCIDATTGTEITLLNSEAGVEYTLSNDTYSYTNTILSATGGPLSFGFVTQQGVYTITAFNPANECTATMNGSATLVWNPTTFSIRPNDPNIICPGAQDIWLNGSEPGVSYTLFLPNNTQETKTGNGGILNWGKKYLTGTYYIHAYSIAHPQCNTRMAGTVVIVPNPGVYEVVSQGLNCEPAPIGMLNSEAGVTYEIVDALLNPLPTPVTYPSSGGPFTFPGTYPAGIYKVVARSSQECTAVMAGQVKIDRRPTVNAGTDAIICNIPPYNVQLHGQAEYFSSVLWSSPTAGAANFDPGPDALEPFYTFTQADINNKSVTLTLKAFAILNEGCMGTWVTDQVTIELLAPIVEAGDNVSLCANEPVQLAGSVTGGTTTGTWSGGMGNFDPDRNALNATYTPHSTEAGTTVVLTLTSTGAYPCPNVSDAMSITIFNELMPGTAGNDQTICTGQSPLNLVATAPVSGGSGTFTYQWQVFNGSAWISAGAGATSLVFNPGILTTSSMYRLRQTDTWCNPDQHVFTNPVIITVNPLGQVNQPEDQIVCHLDNTQPVIFSTLNPGGITTYQWSNSNTTIGLAASGAGDIPAFQVTNPGPAPVTATITVTPVYTFSDKSCPGDPKTFTITVNPAGQVNQPIDITVCGSTPLAPVVFTTGNAGGSTTYQWTCSNTTIGLPASGTGNLPGFTTLNPGTAPVSATITVTPTYTGSGLPCQGPPKLFTITILPAGQVNQPANALYCHGDITELIEFTTVNGNGTTTFLWTNDHPSIGLPANGSGDIGPFTATNSGMFPIVATITVTPEFGVGNETCQGDPVNFTITVNPPGQVNQPPSQTVCHTAVTAPITFSTANTGGTTTYSWVNDNSSIGLAAAGIGDNIPGFPAQNPGLVPITATITVTPHFTLDGLTCDGTPKSFTITVNPGGHVMQPSDLAICHTEWIKPPDFITNNTGGTVAYSWSNNNPDIGLPPFGNGNLPGFNAINGGESPVEALITVTPTYTSGGISCPGASVDFTITVNPAAQVDQISDITGCHGETIAAPYFTTWNTGGNTTYLWSNGNTTIGLPSSGTGNLPSFTANNINNSPETAVIQVYAIFENAGTTCDGPSITFSITVNPAGQVNPQSDIVECEGATIDPIFFTTNNTGGTYNYQWTNSNTLIGLAASGTNNIPQFTTLNGFPYPISATITVTPEFTNGGDPCEGTEMTFTITVNPKGQINQPANVILCDRDLNVQLPPWSTLLTGGTTTFAWSNSDPSIGLPAAGTGNLPMFNAVNEGNMPVTATITVIPTFTNAGKSCPGDPVTFQITVNPKGQVNQPPNVVKCNTALINEVVFSTLKINGTTTYTWTNSNPSIGLPSSGEGNLPSFEAVNNGYGTEVAVITVTPTFTNGNISCPGESKTFTIIVNPSGHVVQPENLTFCHQDNTTQISFSSLNTGGVTTYSWSNSEPLIGLAASGSGNIISFIALNGNTAPLTATITVTPVFTNLGISCSGTPKTFTITVNPLGQVNQPLNITKCNGETIAPDPFTTINTGGTTTYHWSNDNTTIGLPAGGNGNIPAFTAINTDDFPVTATIEVFAFFENAGTTCDGPSKTFTITVNPDGQVNQQSDIVECEGSTTLPIVFNTNNTGGFYNYQWTNSNTLIGLAANGTNTIPPFTTQNDFNYPITGTIAVTPQFTNGGEPCDGVPMMFDITVNPQGQVNQPEHVTLCDGDQNVLLPPWGTINTGGVTTLTWSNSDPSIGLPAAGTGNLPMFNAVNEGYMPVTATITVIPTFTNAGKSCPGDPVTFQITVNPKGKVNKPPDLVVCNTQITNDVVFSTVNINGTTTYAWTNSNPSIGLPSSGNGDLPSFSAINGGYGPEVAVITVTPTFTNGNISCPGESKTFTITVNPSGHVVKPENLTFCHQQNTTLIAFSSLNTGGTTSYTWSNSEPLIGLPASGSGNIIPFIALNNDNTAPLTATITVTPVFTNLGISCSGTPKTFTITVDPLGDVNQPQDITECNGTPITPAPFTTINTGGTTTYHWSNSNTTIGLAATGTGHLPAFDAINTGNSPETAVIQVYASFENDGTTCDGPSKTFTITVNPGGKVDKPADMVLCHEEWSNPVLFTSPNSGGTITYAWTNSHPEIGLSSSGNGNITSFQAQNGGNSPIVATIQITPTFTLNNVSCEGQPVSFTITVNPEGLVNQPDNHYVCHEDPTPEIIFNSSNAGGTTTYTWSNNMPVIGLPAAGTGNISSFQAVNAGYAPITADITVTPTFTANGKQCEGNPVHFSITVNPTAVVNKPADVVLCHDQQSAIIDFISLNSGGTMTYYWENSLPAIGLPAAGWGPIPSFTAINQNFFPREATITVIPFFTNGPLTCEGVPVTFTITVNPAGEVNQPPDMTVCNQDETSPILFTTPITGGEVTYYWTNDNPSIGLAEDGNGNVPSFTATNTEPNPVTANLTVTPTFRLGNTPCPGPTKTFTITVNPNGQVNQPVDLTVCEGDPVAAEPFTTINTGGTTTYQWTNNNPSIGLPSSGTGDLPVFTAINSGLSPVSATIEVTALFENAGTTCIPLQTRIFTITVNPVGEVNQPPDLIVCNGEATAEVEFTTPLTGGVVYYEWSNSNPSIGLAANGTGNLPSFVAVNPGQDPVSAVIEVIALFENDGTTCDGPSKSFTINVYGNLAPGTVSQDQIICYGTIPSMLTATPPVGGTLPPVRNYQWQIKTTPPDIWNDIPGATNLNYQPPALTRNTMYRLQVTDPACQTPQTVHSNAVTIQIDIPTANFTADTACLGNLTTFTNLSSSIAGPNLSYQWAFGDGFTDNLKDPAHLYLNPGTYNVTLTVTSSKGCINDTVKQVLVRPLPFAVFTAGDPRCAGDSIVFTDYSTTPSGAICRAEWNFGDGNTKVHRYPQQSQVVKHRYSIGGTYPVTLTVITTDSCRKTVTMPVAVYHAPVAGFYTGDILCKQKEVQFHDMTQSAGGLQIVSWHWNFGDPLSGVNDTSTYQNPLHAFTGTGNYTVTQTVTNMYGCRDTALMTLTIQDKPLANFRADTACLGASTSFTSLSTPSTSISTQVWDFGNGQIVTANNPTYTFLTPGIHMVKLTVINGYDCEDDTIKPVLVLARPAAGYTYQTPSCAGDSIQFTDESFSPHGYITTWTWNFGDGSAPTVITDPSNKNVKHKFENGGTYQVKLLIETSDDCVDSTTTAVTIGEKPLANFSFTPLSPCAKTEVSFTDMTQLNGGTALNSWSWNFGDPGSGINNVSTNQHPLHIYNNPGTYTIRLIVTNITGCTDSVETGQQITVKPLPEASFDVETSCIGSQTLFTSTSTSPNGNIQLCSWNFGDPSSGTNNTATGNPVTHFYNYQGVYNVTLTVSDDASCTRDTVQQVTINTRPTADFLVQNVPCEADTTIFTDQSLPNGSLISGWDWDFGDETPHSFIQNPKHKYEDPGTFNVKLVVTNVLGCKDSITIPVTVHYKPEALFSYQSLYWPAGKVDFIDQSNPVTGSIISRQWTFMPNATGTGQPATYTYPVTGVNYQVTLAVENTMGCRDTIKDFIYVNRGYELGIYSETACLGKPARFHPTNPSRLDGDTLIYIHWDFGDVFNPATNTSSQWNASHVYTHPGTYPVTLTATNSNGHQETVFKTIVPYHPPTATFTFNGGPHCNASEPVIFRYPLDSLGPDPDTIHWHFGHGTWEYELPPFTGEKSHVFPSNGLFNVSMVVVNGNGCRDTLVKPVNLVCISASFDTLTKTYCDSIPIKFTDLSAPSGNIGSWLWNFGDPSSGVQNTSTLQHPTHTFVLPTDESRIFTVKLVVTSNPAGFKDSVSTRITIHPSTTFRVAEKQACLNDSVRFTTSPADTSYLYIQGWEWKFNDQWSTQQGTTTVWNPAHRYKRPGTYYPTLSVTNSYGCIYTDTGKVVIGIPPIAKMVIPDPFCTRQLMTLYDESVQSGAVINYWKWNFNNESTSVSRYPTHRFNEPGEKQITLMIRDQNNCADTVDSLIMVYPTPVGKFIVTRDAADPQGMIRIENLTEPLENTIFLWDFGDGKTSALPDPVYSYSSDGNYTIKMVATVGNGCSDTTFYSLKMLFKGLFVPNAFKPNTMSDYLFKPAGINLKFYSIKIFDPFGRLMWESNKLDTKGQPVEGWDGTYMGQPMPQGNYVWTINAVFADDKAWEGMYNESTGQKHTKGTIVLLR